MEAPVKTGRCISTGLMLFWLALWYFQPRTPTVINAARITNDGKAKIPFLPPATDGLRLYFVEGQPFNSGSGIAQMATAGGETTWMPTSLRKVLAIPFHLARWVKLLVITSPTEGHLSADELWIQPLAGRGPLPRWTRHWDRMFYSGW